MVGVLGLEKHLEFNYGFSTAGAGFLASTISAGLDTQSDIVSSAKSW